MTKQYADLIPSLADLARNLVRDLDPQVCILAVGRWAIVPKRVGLERALFMTG